MRTLLLACFALSGLSGLIYEVAWSRKLGLVFGSTAIAVSVCLATYLGGLALGAYLWGRLANRISRPARAYGMMELAIGLFGLISLSGLDMAGRLFSHWGVGSELSQPAAALFELLLSAAVILPPTILMGGTLPALIRASPRALLGLQTGRLYSANTLGGAVGALLTGFYLLPSLGLQRSVLVAAAINLLLGGIVSVLLWRNPWQEAIPDRATVRRTTGGMPMAIPAIVLGVSGFCSLLYEVVWTRSLDPILGNSSWSFSLMLGTFLTGLALGIAAGGVAARRTAWAPALLALSQAMTGVLVFAGIFALHELPGWFLEAYGNLNGHPVEFLICQAALCGTLSLLPSFWIGATFPLAIAACRGVRNPAMLVGNLYALNTAGTIAGAILAGLVLVPWLGLRGCFLLGSCLNLAMAALSAGFCPGWPRPARAMALVLSLAAGAAFIQFAPQWSQAQMAGGVYYYAPRVVSAGIDRYYESLRTAKIAFYREGRSATVSVVERGKVRVLSVDGRAEGSSRAAAQTMLGHLPMALDRNIQDAFVIGFGTGSTAGSLGLYPCRRIDVADLEPAVIEASQMFQELNHNVRANPKVHIHIADGRTLLAAAPPASYDLVISQPSVPWAPGAGKLFTQDFYRMAHTRLRPQGVFAQWFQLYNLDADGVNSLLKTFSSEFPEVMVMLVGRTANELMLFGSDRPIHLDWESMDRLAAPERVGDLERVGLGTKGSIVARVLFGRAKALERAGSVPLNTDDNGFIEFGAIHNLYLDNESALQDQLLSDAGDPWPFVSRHPAEADMPQTVQDMALTALLLHDYQRGRMYMDERLKSGESYEADLVAGDLRFRLNDKDGALQKWKRCVQLDPTAPPAIARLVSAYSLRRAERRPAEFPEWVALLRKQLHVAQPARGIDPLEAPASGSASAQLP